MNEWFIFCFSSIPKYESLPTQLSDILISVISINSNYTSKVTPSETPGELPKQIGNKTECALLGFVENLGKSYQKIRDRYPEETFVKLFTFNSARKSMSTVIRLENRGYRLLTKGASEMVVKKYVVNLNFYLY